MNNNTISPSNPPSLGIIGGGQLGKMIAQEAKRMSIKVIGLDPSDKCPAASLCDEFITADFKDAEAIMELSKKTSIITYEIELTNSQALTQLTENKFPVHPSPETLRIIQNKFRQKSFLQKNKIPVPRFQLISSEEELENTCKKFGFPLMLKATEDSYDGRGNYVINSPEMINHGYNYFKNREIMGEEFIPYSKEISVMVARNQDGQIESFPVVENIHVNNILDTTIAPARISSAIYRNAQFFAEKTVRCLKGAGIFGIEMFVTKNGRLLLNEIAPRPHNSGHYSIEACSISQFEQHIRAVFNLPLSKPRLLSPAVMVNILGPNEFSGQYYLNGLQELLSIDGLKLHLYGKVSTKPKRKLGHITITAETIERALSKAKSARSKLSVEVLK